MYVELGEIFERKTVNRRFIQPEYNVASVSFVLNEEQLFGSDISCIIDIIILFGNICAREKSETSGIRFYKIFCQSSLTKTLRFTVYTVVKIANYLMQKWQSTWFSYDRREHFAEQKNIFFYIAYF